MKKKIVSPLLSAFVIPGLGQITNGQAIKGSILLGSVTFVLILTFFSIFQTLYAALIAIPNPQPNAELVVSLMEKVQEGDGTLLTVCGIAFSILWLYSVIDAFVYGSRRDRESS